MKSIILHDSNAKSGLYYNIIMDIISNKWILCDDNNIKIKNTLDLKIECFGNNESIYSKPNCKNAYILFYEKLNEKNCEIFQKIKSVNFTKNNIDNLRNNSIINKEYENHIDINEHNHKTEITKNNILDGDDAEYIDSGSSDNNSL